MTQLIDTIISVRPVSGTMSLQGGACFDQPRGIDQLTDLQRQSYVRSKYTIQSVY